MVNVYYCYLKATADKAEKNEYNPLTGHCDLCESVDIEEALEAVKEGAIEEYSFFQEKEIDDPDSPTGKSIIGTELLSFDEFCEALGVES